MIVKEKVPARRFQPSADDVTPAWVGLCSCFKGFHPRFPRKSAAKRLLGSIAHHGLADS